MRHKPTADPSRTPCWLWSRALNEEGYGIAVRGGRYVYAHRMVYEALKGPIPAGLTIDHLCRVRSCVNPDHLEPVTSAENIRRGLPFKSRSRPRRLSMAKAEKIREDYSRGVRVALLAVEYDVSREAIRSVICGKTYRRT